MPQLSVTTSGISLGVLPCLSPRVSVHSLDMLSRWVCIPLPDPPRVWRFLSPHPLPHSPSRPSQALLYLPLIFSYRTSSTSARRPPHIFSWSIFVFPLWKLSLHWRHLNLRNWCNSPFILFLWIPKPPLLLQIFQHTSHWNASVFSISLFLATILSSSSSSARLPLLHSHRLRCSLRSSIMSLRQSLSCLIIPTSDHLFPASLRILFQ